MKRILVAIVGSCFAATLAAHSAGAANVSVPLPCKSPTTGSNPGGYPGPRITNNTGKAIPKGKRLRWHKTESGPGNSMGEIKLSKKLPAGAFVLGDDALHETKCKAEIDKLRVDLWVKKATLPQPGKVTVKLANADEWGAKHARVEAEIYACNAEEPSLTVESADVNVAKGGVATVNLSYTALPGGKATARVVADPHGKYDEISEWNNVTVVSTCPCGGGQECGPDDKCGPGKKCDDGCCAPIPPA